jgi:hypothetical protein
MFKGGCKICSDLLRESMEAISAHVAARARAADAMLCDSGPDLEAHARRVTEMHEAKNLAMSAYENHMLQHRAEDATMTA